MEAYLEDMYRLFTQIKETTGVTPSVFRFPGGSINGYSAGIYQELIAEMLRRGFVPYDWNISSEDATGSYISPDKIVSNITATAGRVNRGFVLMHDSEAKGTTVAALSPMIDRLREMGFTFEKLTPDVKPVLFSYD